MDKENSRTMILNQCLEALGLVLEYDLNDYHTHQHALRVGEGCVLAGERMGLDRARLQKMYYAGMLHDTGKIAIDLKLLSKHGRLTDEEFEIVKTHAVHGSRILAPLPELNTIALWVRWHHERWDGTGYPDGLRRDEIPREVQILSAVDCLDSLQTPRLDRDRLTPERAFDVIRNDRGTFFNPEVLDLVFELVRDGTLVPGRSPEKFLALKSDFNSVPLAEDIYGRWEGYGITSLYPVLRLFARVIDAKHEYTAGHSTRVSILARYLVESMGLPTEDIIRVEVAGLLHDAGKVSIPVDILDKTGKPTDREWEYIRGHPLRSSDILKSITALDDIADIVAYHHERLDGNGYPRNIQGTDIPVLSQVITVADTYDAITSNRTYRPRQSPEAAREVIRAGRGTQFNDRAASILLDTPPKYIDALFDMHGGL